MYIYKCLLGKVSYFFAWPSVSSSLVLYFCIVIWIPNVELKVIPSLFRSDFKVICICACLHPQFSLKCESCHLSYEKSIPKKRGGKTLTSFSLQRERKYGNYISVYSSGILDPCFVFSTVIWVVRIHWFSYVGPH